MSKSGIDTRLAPAATTKAKDKRTLVLFVLGLLLIAYDLLPFQEKEVRHLYGVALEENTHRWRVLSVSAGGDDHDNGVENEIISLKGSVKLVPLSADRDTAGNLPAALALFLNRPLPINLADKETLEMLPGVGPHLAASIANELQRAGRFTGPDDLLKVPGIGPKTLQRLLPLISFE